MAESRQTFFLTGCASGMGQHLTTALLNRGHRVFASDLNDDALHDAAESCGWDRERAVLHAFNVTDYDAFVAAFDRATGELGGVDVMMNIAGVLLASWVHETPRQEIDLQIDVNVKGVIYGTRIAAPHMIARGGGHIVNIASVAGLVPAHGLSTYCASKYAVRSYSMAAAMELRPQGVYVTAFCPSSIQTPMLDNQLHNDAAEIFFTGRSILALEDVEHAIFNRVLKNRPYEVHVPRATGALAHVVNLFPSLGPLIAPYYRAAGRRRQARRRAAEQSRPSQ